MTTLLIALRNLIQGGRRTVLLAFALVLVTFLLIMLDGISAGLEATMIRSATTLSSGHVNIGGFYKVTAGQASPVVTELPKLRALVAEKVEGVDFVIDRARGWARVVSETHSIWGALSGIDIDEERGLKDVVELLEGDFDALRADGTVMLFTGQAKRINAKLGDTLTLSAPTMGGVNNTVDVRVVAIARDVGFLSAINIFMPKNTVRQLYQMRDDASGAVHIYLKDESRAAEVSEALRPELAALDFRLMDVDPRPFWMKFETAAGEDWTGQKLDLTTWREEVSFLLWILTGFATLRWLLMTVIFVVIVVGIMNTLYISIRERTREIGTLRAIGMTRWGVRRLFLAEAILLGIGAGGIGALLGVATSLLVNAARIHIPMEAMQAIMMTDVVHLEVRGPDVALSILVITVVTAIAALLPANLAARLRPAGAIHHVG